MNEQNIHDIISKRVIQLYFEVHSTDNAKNIKKIKDEIDTLKNYLIQKINSNEYATKLPYLQKNVNMENYYIYGYLQMLDKCLQDIYSVLLRESYTNQNRVSVKKKLLLGNKVIDFVNSKLDFISKIVNFFE